MAEMEKKGIQDTKIAKFEAPIIKKWEFMTGWIFWGMRNLYGKVAGEQGLE